MREGSAAFRWKNNKQQKEREGEIVGLVLIRPIISTSKPSLAQLFIGLRTRNNCISKRRENMNKYY